MERKQISDAENRLLILYALEKLGPVSDEQLLQFMVDADLMNYFTLQPALVTMEQQGHLIRMLHPAGSLISLSESGTFALESFVSRIPHSRRDLVDSCSATWISRFRLQQQTPAEYSVLENGTGCIHLRLLQKDTLLMDIVLQIAAQQKLPHLSDRWSVAAGPVYRTITELLLTEPQTESVNDEPDDEHTRIESTGEHHWLVSLQTEEPMPMSLLLLLQDESLAHSAAQRFGCRAGTIAGFVLQALQDAEFSN